MSLPLASEPAPPDELRREALTPLRALLRLAPHERVLTRAEELGHVFRKSPGRDQWSGRCPAHEDHRGSFSLGVADDGTALLRCFAGCDHRDVLAALGLPPAWLFVRGRNSRTVDAASAGREALTLRSNSELLADPDRLNELADFEGWTPAALDALMVGRHGPDQVAIPERDHRGRITGRMIYCPRHARGRSRQYAHHRSDGSRGLIYSAGSLKPRAGLVVVVEGGPTAISVASLGFNVLGFPSASTVGSERAWRTLAAGAEIVVIPDEDDRGLVAAEKISELVSGAAESVAIARLNRFAHKGRGWDAADVLRTHGADVTRNLIEDAISKAIPRRKPTRGRPPTERDHAESYLREVLADGQWRPSREIEEGRPSGISLKTLNRARRQLGVKSKQGNRHWLIRLPEQPQASLSSSQRSDLAF